MRIKQSSNKKKIIITSIAIAVLVAAGASAYFLNQGSNQEDRPENTPDYNAPSDEQKNAGAKAKEDFIKRQDEAEKNKDQDGQNGSTGTPVGLTISSAGQNGSTLQIRTIIEALDDNGTCSLELTKTGADVVTQEAGTQILGSYSVCKGFDIPTEGMQKGSWQAKISYKGSNGQSGSAQRAVEVQ
ncbi:MAG TPA: hypothetical protein VFZ62_02340 [Candidatus Saccharimonadales bacterium]